MKSGSRLWIAMAGVAAVFAGALVVSQVQAQPVSGNQPASILESKAGNESRPLIKFLRERFWARHALKADLGVTQDQRGEIREIVASYRPELAPVVREVVDKRQALREAVLADYPEEDTIREAAAELGDAIADAAVVAADVASEVKQVLTDEQLEQLETFRLERQDQVGNFLDEVLAE